MDNEYQPRFVSMQVILRQRPSRGSMSPLSNQRHDHACWQIVPHAGAAAPHHLNRTGVQVALPWSSSTSARCDHPSSRAYFAISSKRLCQKPCEVTRADAIQVLTRCLHSGADVSRSAHVFGTLAARRSLYGRSYLALTMMELQKPMLPARTP